MIMICLKKNINLMSCYAVIGLHTYGHFKRDQSIIRLANDDKRHIQVFLHNVYFTIIK